MKRENAQAAKQLTTAKLTPQGAVISLAEASLLKKSGYGGVEGDFLTLTRVETLYLLDRGKIRVVDEQGKEYSLKELVDFYAKYDKDIWLKHLVYSDLRKRGYIVKQGFREEGIEFRVYRKGAEVGKEAAKYLVVGIAEGTILDVSELQSLAERAQKAGKELILAVIDRQGEITYYDVSWTHL
ncbi:MAG: tRNA-intron lyase [Candidatus Methanomethylicota archaeon]|uniref:tRNA-intron lyase n=1 Tax=Thermoproteota archaeon TaxID=2056631 RepID=A0A497ETP0_9CREN|nr:MAG: tRNA-intron lyase [Candidatus Verstraetearchaeota archaeon]